MDLNDKGQLNNVKIKKNVKEKDIIEDEIDQLIEDINQEAGENETEEDLFNNDNIFKVEKPEIKKTTPLEKVEIEVEESCSPKKRIAIKPPKKPRKKRVLSEAHKEKLRLGRIKSLQNRRLKAEQKKKAREEKKRLKEMQKKPLIEKIKMNVKNKQEPVAKKNMDYNNVKNFFYMMEQYESYKKAKKVPVEKPKPKAKPVQPPRYSLRNRRRGYVKPAKPEINDGLDFLYKY